LNIRWRLGLQARRLTEVRGRCVLTAPTSGPFGAHNMSDAKALAERRKHVRAAIEAAKVLTVEYKAEVERRIGAWAKLSCTYLCDWQAWKAAYEEATSLNDPQDFADHFDIEITNWGVFAGLGARTPIIPLAFCELVRSTVRGDTDFDRFRDILENNDRQELLSNSEKLAHHISKFAFKNAVALARTYADKFVPNLEALGYTNRAGLKNFYHDVLDQNLAGSEDWWQSLLDWKIGAKEYGRGEFCEIPAAFWPTDWRAKQTSEVAEELHAECNTLTNKIKLTLK
jgi:hypothetical protein